MSRAMTVPLTAPLTVPLTAPLIGLMAVVMPGR